MRNRIVGSSESSGLDKLHTEKYSPAVMEPTLEHPVCFFGPERYEPRYDYPLVVWLHSCGSSERELESVMPELSLQNYVGCAPRAPIACDATARTFRWGSSGSSSAIAEELIFDAIELASLRFSISEKRVFLAGFGSGATMAWRMALRYPQRFAGSISICGDFPHEKHPLTDLASAREMPALWMYGAESQRCGVEQVCQTLPVLHSASLAVDIRQYPCGDNLLTNMLSDANAWIMELVTSQPASMDIMREESFSRN